ncbi:DUF2141 domain-containing protein [Portibacter marinus]|uniref:DUF2141 domain-containing protein n=1 Tax=Portibacter marinus TaxID=2898660 RepID=UPI001F1C1B72|nr:DUF2141 domain-containing protein [Portibacter marinus]
MVSFLPFNENVAEMSISEYKVDVAITGINKMEGDIRIAIYSSNEEFLSEKDIMDFRIVPVDGSTVNCQFKVNEKGQYAMALVHDLNRNGKMDVNFFGWPKEPYAFSKNPGIWFRAPTFEECAIQVDGDERIEIKMK